MKITNGLNLLSFQENNLTITDKKLIHQIVNSFKFDYRFEDTDFGYFSEEYVSDLMTELSKMKNNKIVFDFLLDDFLRSIDQRSESISMMSGASTKIIKKILTISKTNNLTILMLTDLDMNHRIRGTKMKQYAASSIHRYGYKNNNPYLFVDKHRFESPNDGGFSVMNFLRETKFKKILKIM